MYNTLTTVANPSGNTGRQHSFSRVPSVDIPRSVFNRSCGRKTTFDPTGLYPIFVDEALPGDTFNLTMTMFGRLSTPIYPVMDNIYVDVFFFAVPNRLVWDNWEKFNGAQDDPGDSTDFTVPIISQDPNVDTLSDHMGLPVNVGNVIEFNALPFRSYNLIWNEWFRDQNLQNSKTVAKNDGPDPTAFYGIWPRCKRHDYFTSCLPFRQKGDPVAIDLAGGGYPTMYVDAVDTPNFLKITDTVGDLDVKTDNLSVGDLRWGDPAISFTVNEMREAFQVQKLLEKDARGGTRYTEIIRSHFGVISPDQRLQRPEFLGGGTFALNMYTVPKTDGNNVGETGAFATFDGKAGFMKSFTEHCTVIGLVNCRADITYQQGIERMWSRQTRYDYYWPSLALLGEQAVLSKEIWTNGLQSTTEDNSVFGYQERYAEYRYKPSTVSGQFRSDGAYNLDEWHLALDFASRPSLNDAFIQDAPPMDRIVAANNPPKFIADCFFDFKCARPMPVYSVPGQIDRF